MARFARAVAIHTAHHITQRGVDQQRIFFTDADRNIYLDCLAKYCAQARARILAYCLMSNHIHLVLIPEEPDSLAVAMRRTHSRYSLYLNARRQRVGHLWQNRFYSCPLDEEHLWIALGYVEKNPVRANLVSAAEDYKWSSAAAHLGIDRSGSALLDWGFYATAGGETAGRSCSRHPKKFSQSADYSVGRSPEGRSATQSLSRALRRNWVDLWLHVPARRFVVHRKGRFDKKRISSIALRPLRPSRFVVHRKRRFDKKLIGSIALRPLRPYIVSQRPDCPARNTASITCILPNAFSNGTGTSVLSKIARENASPWIVYWSTVVELLDPRVAPAQLRAIIDKNPARADQAECCRESPYRSAPSCPRSASAETAQAACCR